MTYKQIEASREARLWLTQIILPITAVVMLVPESRNAVVTKIKEAKKVIETSWMQYMVFTNSDNNDSTNSV